MKWAPVRGRAEVVELRLRSLDDPPVPITTTLLRSLSLGSAIDTERTGWGEALADLAEDDDRWSEHAEHMNAPLKRGGHPALPANELARVAAIYRDALARNDNPTQAVAKSFHLSQSGAAKRVRRARDKGLLPETTPGVAAADNPTRRRRAKR